MKVTMISHASVLIEHNSVAILTDPWFLGEVFNESWSLLCEPAMTSTALQGISHIWISHEHPDHLHFPTLRAIPEEQRSGITLLYQRHFSPRVANALARLGFRQVVELPLGHWCQLDNRVAVISCSVGTIDSLLAVRADGVTVLNLNDCEINPTLARAVAHRIGPVDVLLTQFSIANWVGNPNDTDIAAKDETISRMRLYIRTFQPKVTIPFASFVYFSHDENRHMNTWINTPDYVCKQLSDTHTQLQFLYNGDSWSSRDGFRLERDPLQRYRADFQKIGTLPYRSHPSCSLDELLTLGQRLSEDVRRSFPGFLLLRTMPIHFYVVDLGVAIDFNLCSGTVEAERRTESECDVALSSQALSFAFKFPWGLSTLEVSGRYQLINPKLNKLALYLCHLYASDVHCKGLWRRLIERRVLNFCWSKRHDILGRLLSNVLTSGG